uniref:flagellar hook-basal body complex protein n=2 Tax=Pseudomonas TaxID=286 RepID=UPI001A936C9F
FFVLSTNGSLSYTRAGAFKADKEGYITTSDGTARLQGYAVDANGKIINGVLTDLRIDTSNLAPKPTSSISSTINLNSSEKTINVNPTAPAPAYVFDPTKSETYSKQFSTPVYDSQGNKHVMDQYMIKTSNPNEWVTYTLIDGRNPDGTAFSMANQAPITIKFDSSGKLQSLTPPAAPATSPFTVSGNSIVMGSWTPGNVVNGTFVPNGSIAAAGGVKIDMTKTGSVLGDTARSVVAQNGYSTGQITNLTIDGSGVMLANFSNEQTKPIGQISLASFTNEQGLQPIGGTQWKETY